MRTDGRTDTTKLIVPFRNFANSSKLYIKTLSEAVRVLLGVHCKKAKEGSSKLNDRSIFLCSLQENT